MTRLKTWGVLGASAVALLAAGAGAQSGQGDGGKIKPVLNSTVRVLAQMPNHTVKMGTGWIIEEADRANRAGGAIVITARHLVDGAVKVTVVEPGSEIGDQRPAVVHAATAERDLAFLEVKDISEPALTIDRTLPNVGDTVRGIGFSSASDENEANGLATRASPKLGNLSKVFRGNIGPEASAPIDQIEFDAPILGGFSGGPLVNDCGQVIGVVVKDGGHIRLPEGHQIATASGVSIAVASDEIITAAHDAGVNLTVSSGACGQAYSPPPPPPCPHAYMTIDSGRACSSVSPKGWEKIWHNVTQPTGIIISVAILALAAVVGTALVMRRRQPVVRVQEAVVEVRQTQGVDTDAPLRSLPPQGYSGSPTAPSNIRLTGRGPQGEVIDIRFTAEDLAGPGVVLGVEGDDGAKIPDARPKTYVSRRHASLRFDGRVMTITDLKSSNKTKIGGVELTPNVAKALVSGDRLELADVVLNVTID